MPVAPTAVNEPIHTPLSKEEEAAVRLRIEEMRKLFESSSSKATYKIEVRFMRKRSTWKPVPGVVSFWKSGNRLHGGGDEKIYLCPGKKRDKKTEEEVDCQKLLTDTERAITPMTIAGQLVPDGVVCPDCGKVWLLEQLIGEKIYVLTPQNWATALLHLFVLCKYDADIVLKYSPDDIRSITAREQERQLKGELLTKARNWRKKRGTAIYQLANIIKDTSNGADLYKRFYTFITV
jgi:hypothetical protein